MAARILTGLLVGLLIALGACAGRRDGRALFDQALGVLSTQPLGHDRVDWNRVRAELRPTIAAGAAPREAHDAIRAAIARLNDRHAQFLPPAPPASPPASAPTAQSTAESSAAGPAGRVPTVPEGSMKGDVAYLVLPGCATADEAGLRAYAAAVRSRLSDLGAKQPRGWIIDLRLNSGGNCWPMLLGLQPLLGDGVMTTGLNGNEVRSRCGLAGNAAWLEIGGVRTEPLRLDCPARAVDFRVPVAVLTGSWTMSSAELLTLALKERPGTRIFGEPTAGLTTVNTYFPLSDGSVLNLPTELMADRHGLAPRGSVIPHERVKGGEWPTADDAVAARSAAWIADRSGLPR